MLLATPSLGLASFASLVLALPAPWSEDKGVLASASPSPVTGRDNCLVTNLQYPPYSTDGVLQFCDTMGDECDCTRQGNGDSQDVDYPRSIPAVLHQPREIPDKGTIVKVQVHQPCPDGSVKLCNANVDPSHCQCLFDYDDGCPSGTERLCDAFGENCKCLGKRNVDGPTVALNVKSLPFKRKPGCEWSRMCCKCAVNKNLPDVVPREIPSASTTINIEPHYPCPDGSIKLCDENVDPDHCQCLFTHEDGCPDGEERLCDATGSLCKCLPRKQVVSREIPEVGTAVYVEIHAACPNRATKLCDSVVDPTHCQCVFLGEDGCPPNTERLCDAMGNTCRCLSRKRSVDVGTLDARSIPGANTTTLLEDVHAPCPDKSTKLCDAVVDPTNCQCSFGDDGCPDGQEELCDAHGNNCHCMGPAASSTGKLARSIPDAGTTKAVHPGEACEDGSVKLCDSNIDPSHCQCLFTADDGCPPGTEKLCDAFQNHCRCLGLSPSSTDKRAAFFSTVISSAFEQSAHSPVVVETMLPTSRDGEDLDAADSDTMTTPHRDGEDFDGTAVAARDPQKGASFTGWGPPAKRDERDVEARDPQKDGSFRTWSPRSKRAEPGYEVGTEEAAQPTEEKARAGLLPRSSRSRYCPPGTVRVCARRWFGIRKHCECIKDPNYGYEIDEARSTTTTRAPDTRPPVQELQERSTETTTTPSEPDATVIVFEASPPSPQDQQKKEPTTTTTTTTTTTQQDKDRAAEEDKAAEQVRRERAQFTSCVGRKTLSRCKAEFHERELQIAAFAACVLASGADACNAARDEKVAVCYTKHGKQYCDDHMYSDPVMLGGGRCGRPPFVHRCEFGSLFPESEQWLEPPWPAFMRDARGEVVWVGGDHGHVVVGDDE